MTPSTEVVVKTPAGVSREQFNNVVSAAYTAYLGLRGATPSVDQVASYSNCKKKTVAKILDTDEFLVVITARGCNWTQAKGLTSKQMLSLTVLSNPSDRRDLRAKLRSIGATYAEYQAWLKQPLFQEKVTEITEAMLGDNIGNVHQSLVNQATGGNVRAIELFYQITGRHDPAQKQVVQMDIIIKLLLEILTRRISDTEVLDMIVKDIGTEVMPKMITSTVLKG
jgi:hypothetical protein